MRIGICFLLATALLGGNSMAEANDHAEKAKHLREWKGIVPGQSTLSEVEGALGAPSGIFRNSSWRGVSGLEGRDYEQDGEPYVSVRYRNGKVVVISQAPSYSKLPKAERTLSFYRKALGKPKRALRSWKGKTFQHWVWPELGIALDVERSTGRVAIRMLFAPMTRESYRKQLYREPPPFRK